MDEVCFLSYQPSINFCLPQISHKSKQIRHIKKKKKQKNKQQNPLTDQSKAMTFHLVTSEFKKSFHLAQPILPRAKLSDNSNSIMLSSYKLHM